MAAFEILALDPTTPQIRAPGATDTYVFPRAVTPSANSTGITISGYSLTGTNAQSLLDLSGTWNTTGTPTALKLNVTDTASNANSRFLDIQIGGSAYFGITKYGLNITNQATYGFTQVAFSVLSTDSQPVLTFGNTSAGGSASNFGFSLGAGGGSTPDVALYRAAANIFKITVGGSGGAGNFGSLYLASLGFGVSSADLFLARDAANTLAQRNGVNAQTSNIYNTFTDASNYERGAFTWFNNEFYIVTNNAGTGSARNLNVRAANLLKLGANGNVQWRINTSGHFVAETDNTNDIGASGATRPRNIFAAGYVVTGSTTVASLPAASTAGAGARAFVTDATATTFLSTVAGGGANAVPVVSNGTNWLIG